MHLVARDSAECKLADVFGQCVDWWERLLGPPGRSMIMRFEPELSTSDLEPPSSYSNLGIPAEGLILWVYPSGVAGSSINIRREQSFAILGVSLRQGTDLGKPFSSLATEYWSRANFASRLALFAGEELEMEPFIIRGFLSGKILAESIELCELVITD
jgi:hypothetical protein